CARETSATLAPSSRNARAHDNPMPLLPPVINTTLSASPSSTIPPAEITEIDYSSLRQFKGDRDAGEHRGADPVVVEEGTETVRRSTMPDEPQLIEDHANSRGKSDVVRPGEPQVKANSYHHRDEGPMKQRGRRDIVTAEQDRRGTYTDLAIILAIDHRILGVVGNRPRDLGRQQDPGNAGYLTNNGCIAHGNAEAEGNTEIGLRHEEEALGQGIAHREEQRKEGQHNGE